MGNGQHPRPCELLREELLTFPGSVIITLPSEVNSMYLSRTIGYSIWISPGWVANGPIGDGTVHPPKVVKTSPISEQYTCPTCGGLHDKVWYYRPTKGRPFGNFMAVRIGAEWHVPDGSLPHNIERIPRSAVELTPELASACWHDKSGSHDFTGNQGSMIGNWLQQPEQRKILYRYARKRRW
jgi:hypothetical protein